MGDDSFSADTKFVQDQPIKGYRSLTEEELLAINRSKDMEELALTLVSLLQSNPTFDQRWVSIGKTHIQQGFMALVRGIARPE